MIKAKVIKYSCTALVAIFEDDRCIGEKSSNQLIIYPGQKYDIEEISSQLEELIEKQYDSQKAGS